MLGIRVLGALEADIEGPGSARRVDLGGRRQRALLTLLLVARGQAVSVDRIVEALWHGAPPRRPVPVVQAYVSHLRRALEPDRVAWSPAAVLCTQRPGYAVRLPSDAVDAWRFEELVRRGSAAVDPAAARRGLQAALDLWRGPAFPEVADEPWALPEISRLEGLRVNACEQLGAALLATGDAAAAVALAEKLTDEHPMREQGWALLATGMVAAGRQADALAALRRARARFVDEAGLDPSRGLARLESDILAQRTTTGAAFAPTLPTPPRIVASSAPRSLPLVGRGVEMAALIQAAESALRGARTAVVLIDGEAGAGKSALLQGLADRQSAAGWQVVSGRCPEDEGAPPAWAWSEVLRTLARAVDLGQHAGGLAPLLDVRPSDRGGDPTFGRFLLQRAVCEFVVSAAKERPLAILLDDVHRADSQTLSLLAAVAGETAGPLLVAVAYRPDEGIDGLRATLAGFAQQLPTRITLSGLGPDASAALLTAVAGEIPDVRTLDVLVDRAGGNPLYLIESARLLRSDGPAAATARVPDGVRDVLRRRIARLGGGAHEVLCMAAVVGRDVDVEVLVCAMTGADPLVTTEAAIEEALDGAVLTGVLDETAPGRLRFTHVLMRDVLYADVPAVRRGRWHARVADAIASVRSDDVAALAHHLYRSGRAAAAGAAVAAGVAAGDEAMARYAPEVAVELYRQALGALDRAPSRGTESSRVDVLCRLGQAELAAGSGVGATHTRTAALRVAERSRDDRLVVRALVAWNLPTPWTTTAYGTLDAEVVALLDRALRIADLDADTRCQLLCVRARELAGHRNSPAGEAAVEAERLARRSEDPLLIGLALQARGSVLLHESDIDARLLLADELLDVGSRPGLAVFALLGHVYRAQWAATYGDVTLLAGQVEQMAALVRLYRWRQGEAVVLVHRGLLAHLVGDLAEAERLYRDATGVLQRNGGLDAEKIGGIALFSVALTAGRIVALEQLVRSFEPLPPEARDMLTVVLAAGARFEEARSVHATAGEVRCDFFRSLFLTIRGLAVIGLARDGQAEPAEVCAVYDDLCAFRGQLGGAITGAFALGPVDTVLGDLARRMDRTAEAADHYGVARALARRCGSPFWEGAAAERLKALEAHH